MSAGDLLGDGRYSVHDNDGCCESCAEFAIRDVRCSKCGELYVTDQDEIDAGWVPGCLEECFG